WSRLTLVGADGVSALDLGGPSLAADRSAEPAFFTALVGQKEPTVSDLIDKSGRPMVYIAVPVPLQRQIRYALVGGMEPAVLAGPLSADQLPAHRIGVVFDRGSNVLASSIDGQGVGSRVSPELIRMIGNRSQGSLANVSIDATDAYAGFYNSKLSGW